MNTPSLQHELLTKELTSYKDCKYKLRVENYDSSIQFYAGFSSWKIFIAFFPMRLTTWNILVEIVFSPQEKKEAHQELWAHSMNASLPSFASDCFTTILLNWTFGHYWILSKICAK